MTRVSAFRLTASRFIFLSFQPGHLQDHDRDAGRILSLKSGRVYAPPPPPLVREMFPLVALRHLLSAVLSHLAVTDA